MAKGPQDQQRLADMIGGAAMFVPISVSQIIEDTCAPFKPVRTRHMRTDKIAPDGQSLVANKAASARWA